MSEGSVHTCILWARKKVGISCEMDLLRTIIRCLDEQSMRSLPEQESSGA